MLELITAPGPTAASVGDFVKVKARIKGGNARAEAFWVKVTYVSQYSNRIKGAVDNDLESARELGVDFGDKIVFTQDHVHELYMD